MKFNAVSHVLKVTLLWVICSATHLGAQSPVEKQLGELLPKMADPTQRAAVTAKIKGIRPFPAKELTNFLGHEQLNMRLATLELLEEHAGSDFNFDPWKAPNTPENLDAFERWLEWATNSPGLFEKNNGVLNEKQRLAYLSDLLSGDFNKASRAAQMLEYDGLEAVGFLEQYLTDNPNIPGAQRASIRSAQYQITLSTAFGPSAGTMAKHLAFGNRDQVLTTLAQLKTSGLLALPVINEFLEHPDPLVRETAIDAMLSSGGHKAIPTVTPALLKETDPNVIHGALRRLKTLRGKESLAIAVNFLDHENEDLKISSIQACQLLLSGGSMMGGNFYPGMRGQEQKVGDDTKKAHDAIIAALSDSRWRVRAAALETVAKCRIRAAGDDCIRLLNDPDRFVSYNAINAIKSLRLSEADDALKKIIMESPEHAGLALACYASLGNSVDKEMKEKILSYSADVRLGAVEAAKTESGLRDLLITFADDKDDDVACAALRGLVYNDNNLKQTAILSIVVSALESGNAAKQDAIINNLDLPRSSMGLDPDLATTPQSLVGQADSTEMDQLYASLLMAAAAAQKDKPAGVHIPKSQSQLIDAVKKVAQSGDSNAFSAAIALAKAGYKEGHQLLLDQYADLTTGEKARLSRSLYSPNTKPALDLLSRLIREPVEEIRNNAITSCFSTESTEAFVAMALEALSEAENDIRPHNFYNYRLESAIREGGNSARAFTTWARQCLKDDKRSAPQQVLAMIILKNTSSSADRKLMLKAAQSSPDKWVRRAAWHGYGKGVRSMDEHLQEIADDPSPYVRQVIPNLYSRIDMQWTHHFTDLHIRKDSFWGSSGNNRSLSSKAEEILQAMAKGDPSNEIRFTAMAALMSLGKDIDADALAKLLRNRPKDERASYRMADWMEDNLRRIGPGLAPVAAALDPSEVDADNLKQIISRTNPKANDFDLTSFTSLAKQAQQSSDAPQQVGNGGAGGPQEVERNSLLVIYFYKPGCNECEDTQRMLDLMRRDFPLLELRKLNITETEGTLLNQMLCSNFGVPAKDHNIAPAIFTQAGHLIRSDIDARAIGKLFQNTMQMPQADDWATMEEPERKQAAEVIEKRYQSLTLPIVIVAGLIDGINPCAFATIIFFLSYLQIARRSRLEMIQVGVAFIVAVFIAYFSAGLFLHKVLEKVTSHVSGVKVYLDWIFAGLAFAAAALSFRDAARAKQGRLDEMTLTLPDNLKDRIRSVIRVSSKSRHYVITAFVAGIIISFLELACTGQVYAPIIYSIQQGKMDAVAWLAAYNVAFILPLVVIFVMAVMGMSNKRLIDFQQRHTFGVKIGLGLIFVLLALVILFGSKFLY